MDYTRIALYSQVISAVLFVAAMVWIWIRFIQPAVLSAQQNQNAQLAEAERHRDEAKRVLEGLQGEIGIAKRDAQAIKGRIEAQAAVERDNSLREAREAGERALRNAEAELDRGRAAARERLREDLVNRALAMARTEAANRIDAAADAKLVGAFVGKLERGEQN